MVTKNPQNKYTRKEARSIYYDSADEYDAAYDEHDDSDESEEYGEYGVDDYFTDFVFHDEEKEEGEMCIGTWRPSRNHYIYLSNALKIKGVYKVGLPVIGMYFSTMFGASYKYKKTFDIMKITRYGCDVRCIVKTMWLKLIQRHWKNKKQTQGIKGLLHQYRRKQKIV